ADLNYQIVIDTFITRLDALGNSLEGDLRHDKITTTIYSTDASVYYCFVNSFFGTFQNLIHAHAC
ncbi:MAG: hypothetical protein NT043_01355, partial [Candidatus Bathyarchaeota archaeon]|nr:hypothetical protein [Candidatus Bathyarchaeota archaeon]